MPKTMADATQWLKTRSMPFVAGAVAALAVTLGAGWLTTDGAADTRAQVAAVNALAAICTAQAQADPAAQAQLAAFGALNSSYKEREFVEDAGWAVMPNQTAADDAVVRACAAQLAAMAPPA